MNALCFDLQMPMHCDLAIIGGGVAGLWTANALRARGYRVLLFSDGPVGQGQTLASQGVIHGGAKYAVAGKLTDSSEQLAGMPSRWRKALDGGGDVDLRGAQILSEHQYLWSLPSVASQVVTFFGSKLMRGRAAPLPKEEWPEALSPDGYKGRVFRIDEPVLDPVSLVKHLLAPIDDIVFEAKCEAVGTGGQVEYLQTNAGEIRARHYVFAAGAGNEALLQSVGIESPGMQRRPLHQLIVRGDLPPFYSVCIGTGPKPPLVTTTHTDSRGRTVWWIGGDIAEAKGVARSEEEQIAAGRNLLDQVLPWIPWNDMEFLTARADRAEPFTGTGDRPPGAFCQKVGNVFVTWPIKLALAPDLADQVAASLEPSASGQESISPLNLPRPTIGTAPWDCP